MNLLVGDNIRINHQKGARRSRIGDLSAQQDHLDLNVRLKHDSQDLSLLVMEFWNASREEQDTILLETRFEFLNSFGVPIFLSK